MCKGTPVRKEVELVGRGDAPIEGWQALGDEAAQRPDESVQHWCAPESRQLE
jgi:hypothetical protein